MDTVGNTTTSNSEPQASTWTPDRRWKLVAAAAAASAAGLAIAAAGATPVLGFIAGAHVESLLG